MLIVIAGATGFLGRALQAHLRAAGHEVRVLTRQAARQDDAVEWQPDGSVGPWAAALENADAVVNLSGAGIADARWTKARKEVLRSSRILPTRSLVLAIRGAARPPSVLVQASAVGYYGDRGSQPVTEATPAGNDFLATLCVEWEREAQDAATALRVVCLRNGVVLDPSGGALGKMLLPFRLGLGGPLGSGAQYFPWIHLADWLAFTTAAISHSGAAGAFNLTAPVPVTNHEFTKALGRALGRPTVIPVPGFALRAALGELAGTLLTGQRAVPKRAEELDFRFRYPEIEPALRALL